MFVVLFLLALAPLLGGEAKSNCTKTSSAQFDIRHTEPKGIGYKDGYTTGQLYWIYSRDVGGVHPYIDLRGHVFNKGTWALNAGIGGRGLAKGRVWGGNFYYDSRNTRHKWFNQLSFGFETMGELWDLYANGYLLVGPKNSRGYGLTFDHFENHYAVLKQKKDSAMSGADAKFRLHCLKKQAWDVYFDIGPYYYRGSHSSLWGGKIGLGAVFANWAFCEGTASYDHIFKWIGQGILGVRIPLGEKICLKNTGSSNRDLMGDRIAQIPEHNEIIVVDKIKKQTLAIDPATGLPYYFLFVNNLHPFSDGSYEDPFGSLAAASAVSKPRDIIYVLSGDGTSTRMASGITMLDYQQLLGSGTTQNFSTTKGGVAIPPLTPLSPIITNTAGEAVTLANYNTVSGIHIDTPLTKGIAGTGSAQATIINNTITNINTMDATDLAGIDIEGPGMAGTYLISNNVISGTSARMIGIRLQPKDTDVCAMNVSQNEIAVRKDGIEIQPRVNSIATLLVEGNRVSIATSERGVFLEPHGTSSLAFVVKSNTISTTGDIALYILARDTSSTSGEVSGNQFLNNNTGFKFETGGSATTSQAAISNNRFSGNTDFDFLAEIPMTRPGKLCFSLVNNSAPDHGYTLDNKEATSSLNVTSFVGNTGTLNDIGTTPATTSPTCP